MKNVVNMDRDVMVAGIVDALGGGQIDWKHKEVELINHFLGKKFYNINELCIAFTDNARDVLYRRG